MLLTRGTVFVRLVRSFSAAPRTAKGSSMDRFFGLSESNTTFRREILAGLSTFLTMSFIVAVNPCFSPMPASHSRPASWQLCWRHRWHRDHGIMGQMACRRGTGHGAECLFRLWSGPWAGFHLAAGTDRRFRGVGAVLPSRCLAFAAGSSVRFQPPSGPGSRPASGFFSP